MNAPWYTINAMLHGGSETTTVEEEISHGAKNIYANYKTMLGSSVTAIKEILRVGFYDVFVFCLYVVFIFCVCVLCVSIIVILYIIYV